jgi:hypothetical protein
LPWLSSNSPEPDGADASVIGVSQTHYDFQLALAESSSLSVIETFWAVSLGNLVDLLKGRGVGYRCDFTSSDLRAETRQVPFGVLCQPHLELAWAGECPPYTCHWRWRANAQPHRPVVSHGRSPFG